MSRFNKKIAIITGGSNGLGANLAARFANEGAFVYILDIDQKNGEKISTEICKTGGEAKFIYANILDYEYLKKLAHEINAKHSKIDILINNAGGALLGDYDIAKLSEKTWNSSININLNGAFYCSKAVLPYMKEHCLGVITNVGSVNGNFVYGHPGYSVAKKALVSLTQSIAIE